MSTWIVWGYLVFKVPYPVLHTVRNTSTTKTLFIVAQSIICHYLNCCTPLFIWGKLHYYYFFLGDMWHKQRPRLSQSAGSAQRPARLWLHSINYTNLYRICRACWANCFFWLCLLDLPVSVHYHYLKSLLVLLLVLSHPLWRTHHLKVLLSSTYHAQLDSISQLSSLLFCHRFVPIQISPTGQHFLNFGPKILRAPPTQYNQARLLAAAGAHSGDWLHALPNSVCDVVWTTNLCE